MTAASIIFGRKPHKRAPSQYGANSFSMDYGQGARWGMDHFQLCESMLIGHEQIDAEHQALVDVLNHGLDLLATSPQVEAVRDVLDEFRTKLSEHIANEEVIMTRHGFTELEGEKAEHHNALACLDDLIERHLDEHDFETLIRDIAGLMLGLFIKSDMSFKVYLEKIRDG